MRGGGQMTFLLLGFSALCLLCFHPFTLSFSLQALVILEILVCLYVPTYFFGKISNIFQSPIAISFWHICHLWEADLMFPKLVPSFLKSIFIVAFQFCRLSPCVWLRNNRKANVCMIWCSLKISGGKNKKVPTWILNQCLSAVIQISFFFFFFVLQLPKVLSFFYFYFFLVIFEDCSPIKHW